MTNKQVPVSLMEAGTFGLEIGDYSSSAAVGGGEDSSC